jgi:DNA-binding FadR family transcriptional regulator
VNGTPADLAALADLAVACRDAETWREYEAFDAKFHHQVAEAAHNPILLALLETLNAVRRAVTWGRSRPGNVRPPADHHSFADHDRIVAALNDRQPGLAADAMRAHLQNVEDRLVGRIG